MIRVIEKNGKWEQTTFCIDPDQLEADNPVDAAILKELKKISKRKRKPSEVHMYFPVEYSEETDGEIFEVSNSAHCKHGENDDLVIWLEIDYNP